MPFQGIRLSLLLLGTTAALAAAADPPVPEKPTYNRDVRPILADACFRCHGFDKNTREGGRRLDTREGALADHDGVRAIVPGDAMASALLQRLVTEDADDVMPPPEEARQLSPREKEILRRWVASGAEYEDHWAYIPPNRPPIPQSNPPQGNPVDRFVRARLQSLQITPAPEADRVTLARRVSYDLTGLPPSPAEIAAFVTDQAPDAYERMVDRLMASPAYGERMAVWWLDQVRYADTIGYHSDNPMPVSPFRDYVIRSFNANKPFDQFTVEQIAGDLLPERTSEQLVASAYNRLILSTEEGGSQPKQYEAKYLVDRVKSIGTTWLGQTFMCAECHDHKYDPVTARDFYALGAFFADIEEVAVGGRGPGVPVPDAAGEAAFAAARSKVAELEAKLAGPHPELEAERQQWEASLRDAASREAAWQTLAFDERKAMEGTVLEPSADGAILAKGAQADGSYVLSTPFTGQLAGLRLEALPHDSLPARGPGRAGNGNFVITEAVVRVKRASGTEEEIPLSAAHANHEQMSHGNETPWKGWPAAAAIDRDEKGREWGWAILPEAGKRHVLTLSCRETATLAAGDRLVIELRQHHASGTHSLGHFRIAATAQPNPAAHAGAAAQPDLLAALGTAPEVRSGAQRQLIEARFRESAKGLDPLRGQIAEARKELAATEAAQPRCLVTTSMPNRRTVRILPRGDWQNESGEVVLPATPAFLPSPLTSSPEKPLNRLDLARWLVSPGQPLTARVAVNRLWKLWFGSGLVKTLDDLGTQSEIPVHQPLLDWLASEFEGSGWNVKQLVRLMVTSRTYRQSSVGQAAELARDPLNRDLARGGRWRLDAEFVRDNALAISGLLVRRVGGPSVKPWQPAGYWENLNFPQREWENSSGENQWRRGLYTWWQRSYVQPSLLAFDAPTREECAADRTRSNIPQQALVLLNDLTYVEAARAFSVRIVKEGGNDDPARLAWAWREATGRAPAESEAATLAALLAKHRTAFQQDEKSARDVLGGGQFRVPDDIPPAEAAAWHSVARVLLNLHETITRP